MRQSESVKNLVASLVKVQSEIKNLYPSSNGYGYDYVPLEKIIDLLKIVLPKNGLGYIQLPFGGQNGTSVGLTTRIIHESGEWIEETAEFPITDMKGVNKTQAAGAAITYFRRYALISAFGITGDKDVDANDKAFSTVPQNTTPDSKELEKTKLLLEDWISSGFLTGQGLEKAKAYIAKNDIEGMKRTIDWCKKQEQSA